MPFLVVCAGCGQRMGVPDNAAGQFVKCPGCGSVLAVGAAPAEAPPPQAPADYVEAIAADPPPPPRKTAPPPARKTAAAKHPRDDSEDDEPDDIIRPRGQGRAAGGGRGALVVALV